MHTLLVIDSLDESVASEDACFTKLKISTWSTFCFIICFRRFTDLEAFNIISIPLMEYFIIFPIVFYASRLYDYLS